MYTSLVDYFERAYRHGRETAFVHRRGYRTARWSYAEVLGTARRFARELEARAIGPGDHVVLWGENCAEWVAAFFGCVLRGCVVVPMDSIAAPDFARRVAQQVGARLLVAARKLARGDETVPMLPLDGLHEAMAQLSDQPYPSPAVARTATAQVVFTSGTTAEPRGVVLTHGNLLANLEPVEKEIAAYRRYERLVHPIRFLNLVPLSHVFGQFMGMLVPPLLPGTVVFLETLSPADVIHTIRRERVSVLVAVPRLLETLKDKIERDAEAEGRLEEFRRELRAAEGRHFLRRWWRFRGLHRKFGWKFWALISGGATLPAELEAFWSALGYAVIQGYGLTETGSLVSVNHPFRLGKGSIGKALPGRDIRLAPNGEILVRGESIAAGYWQAQQLQPVAGEDGWFHTGDVAELGPDGSLYFKGRQKNVIVTAQGMKVYPEDLEAVLRQQPEVRDCVVLGIEHRGNAEPCAVLLLREPNLDVAGVIRRANAALADFQQIRQWFVWPNEDFPRTSTLKPRTGLILEFVRSQTVPGGAVAAAGGPLAELIARVRGRATGPLTPEARLGPDLNLSSVDRVELLSAMEDRYQVELDGSIFSEATTVGELEQLLRRPQRAVLREHVYPRWPQRWPVTWLRVALYYLLVRLPMLLLAHPRVSGREKLAGVRGPILVVANHITMADPAFILVALPFRLRNRLAVAMIGERLRDMRKPPAGANFFRALVERIGYGLLLMVFNVFPLPQETGFRESFAFAGDLVDRGWSVLVFPEGGRTQDGRIAPFRKGIGILAESLRLPVLPVRIDGLFELKQARRKWAKPGTVRVTVGDLVWFAPSTAPDAITRELEIRLGALDSTGPVSKPGASGSERVRQQRAKNN